GATGQPGQGCQRSGGAEPEADARIGLSLKTATAPPGDAGERARQQMTLGGCGTWKSPAANRPQRPIFGFAALREHRLFDQLLGYWAANPAKTGLARADLRFRRSNPDRLQG